MILSEMQHLLDDDNLYLVYFPEQDFQSAADFVIYEVQEWDDDTPIKAEIYLSGRIKWDGCSNLEFGDGGAIHLCGKYWFEKHKRVMDAIWNLCSKKIIGWDEDIAGK